MLRIHFVFLLCIPPALVSVLFAQNSHNQEAELAGLVRAVVDAKTPQDAATASHKLFKGADSKKLERLKQSKEDAVALRAAWREMVLGGTPRTMKHPEVETVKVVARSAGARFLGFVEGRLGITVPKWWEACATDAFRIDDKGDSLFSGDPPNPYDENKERPILVSPGVSVRVTKEKTMLRCGNDEILLARDLASKYVKEQSHLCVLIESETLFLAPHHYAGFSFPLACIERSTGSRKWEAKVWGGGIEGGTSGVWVQYASIIGKEDRVIVFGYVSGCLCCYVEAFDRKTGRNLFRFAN